MDHATQARLADGALCLESALNYLQNGWSVLALCAPDHVGFGREHAKNCTSPGKAPWHRWKEFQERRPTPDEVRQWWKEHPNSNVGIALGPVSGLIRIDVEGEAGEKKLAELSGGDLPETLAFRSGRVDSSGRGLLYAIPEGVTLKTTVDKRGSKEELRLQAQGAQTVLPPSRHESGNLYQWFPGCGPGDRTAAQAPAWLVRELTATDCWRSRASKLADGELITEGSRDDTLTSLAGSMRRRGMSEAAIFAALSVENDERCSPPLPEADIRKIAKSVARYTPEEDEPPMFAPGYDPATDDAPSATEIAAAHTNGHSAGHTPTGASTAPAGAAPAAVHDGAAKARAAKAAKPPAEPDIKFDDMDGPPEEEKRKLIETLRKRKAFKLVPLVGVRKLGRGNESSYELLVNHPWVKEVPITGSILRPADVQQCVSQCIGVVMSIGTKKSWCANEAVALTRLAGIGQDLKAGPLEETIGWIADWVADYPSGDKSNTVDMEDNDALFDRIEGSKQIGFFWDTKGRLYLRVSALKKFAALAMMSSVTLGELSRRLTRLGFENIDKTVRRNDTKVHARLWVSKTEFIV